MSKMKQVYFDYNGDYEDFEDNQALEGYAAFGIEFDLYDDDQYWITNDMKETSK